ncbi:MAG TPA: SpoIIE family protein phosphatase [Gaiellaceae bacterium]|nr:SpoIIE family protein phosphatase [Gaiellaceae bacterium]
MTEGAPLAGDGVADRGRPAFARYLFAILLSLLALLLSVALLEVAEAPIFTTLLGAAALSVWYGGLGPGLAAIAVGWTASFWLLLEPRGELVGEGAAVLRWGVALAVAALVVAVSGLLRLGRERATSEALAAVASGRRMEALRDLATSLAAAATTSEVTAVLVARSAPLLDADGAALALVEGEELVLVDPVGLAARTPYGRRMPLGAGTLIGRSVREAIPLRADDRATIERLYPDTAASLTTVQAAVAVPVRVAGELAGAIGFLYERAGVLDDERAAIAATVADLAGQALERARLYERERESRRALERILQIAPSFHAETAEEVTAAICREARLTFGGDYGVLWRVEDGELELVCLDPPSVQEPAGLRLPLADFPRLQRAVRALRISFVADVQATETAGAGLDFVRRLGIRSSLRAPITVGGRAEMLLVVSWRQEQPEPDPSTVVLFRRFADQAGLAVEQLKRRRAEAEAAERAAETRRLQEVTAALSLAATTADVGEVCVEHALAAVGADAGLVVLADGAELALGAARGLTDGELASWRDLDPHADVPFRRALRTGEPVWGADEPAGLWSGPGVVALPLRTRAGVRGTLHLLFREPRALGEPERRWLQTMVSQCAEALERSRLFDQEQRLRVRSERLQGMSAALANALTRADVARVVVDEIGAAVNADGAALAIVDEERQLLRALAWRGFPDSALEGWLEVPLDLQSAAARAVRRRRSAFYASSEELHAEFPELSSRFPLRQYESSFVVPLVAGRRASGVLTVAWRTPAELTPDDVRFVEALAGQAAQALERASHYESERTIAATLQRSVLPARLPRVPGVQLAARYLPGTAELHVGGDWFDAIQLRDGRLGLVVGDVVGKGVQAAATMGQLRNALRALSLDRLKPASTLGRLDQLAGEVLDATFATIVYAVVDPASGACRFASAGHPPPVLLRPDGTVELLEGGRGLPLGTGMPAKYRQAVVELPVGSVLLFYSDGLVERRGRSIDDGIERLRAAMRTGPRSPERLLDHVLAEVVGDEPRGDDVALLALRLLAVAPRPLALRLPSHESSLELVREALRAWLEGTPATPREVEDVVLAAWEACANAVEHAVSPSKDEVLVEAELRDGTVRVTVEDSGRWAPPAQRSDRGLGLRLMRSLMSAVDIATAGRGTRVTVEKVIAGGGPV